MNICTNQYGITFDLESHDKIIREKAIDELSKTIKTNWLFRGREGKPYRETIDEIVEELKENK